MLYLSRNKIGSFLGLFVAVGLIVATVTVGYVAYKHKQNREEIMVENYKLLEETKKEEYDAAPRVHAKPEKMNKTNNTWTDSITYYLNSGDQTKITPSIEKIAENMTGNRTEDIVYQIMRWEHDNLGQCGLVTPPKRTRDVEEILQSHCATGCIDYGLVFVALARAKGIPAVYVETVKKSWLDKVVADKSFEGLMEGHIFAKVYYREDQKWKYFDPTVGRKAEFNGKVFIRRGEPYVIFKEGLDSWSLGMYDMEDFQNKIRQDYF